MAQSVDYKLTENEGRNGKQEKVPNSMYTDMLKLSKALGANREEAQHGSSCNGSKTEWFGRKHQG